MNVDEMTPEQLRIEIAKLNGWIEGDVKTLAHYDASGEMPNWPNDIAAAWELVEEIERGGYFVKISTPQADEPPWNTWTVKVDLKGCGDNNPPPPGGWSFGDAAPLAICRAYLKWKTSLP